MPAAGAAAAPCIALHRPSFTNRSPTLPLPSRPQVNRLELLLSIASFAAALGAMVAGIFGMNLRRWVGG